MLVAKANAKYINYLVSVSLLFLLYIRVNYIVWSVRIDDFFKFKNNVGIQRKEAVMLIFLPAVIHMNRQTDDFSTMSLHAIINVSIFTTIAVFEFFRRIKY